MIIHEDVPALFRQLCWTFAKEAYAGRKVCSARKKDRKRELLCSSMLKISYKILLFDFDDPFDCDITSSALQEVMEKMVTLNISNDTQTSFKDCVNQCLSSSDELSLQKLAFLIPLSHLDKAACIPLIGYSPCLALSKITIDTLNEKSLFKQTPLFLPEETSCYTFYSEELFGQSVRSVDSGYCEPYEDSQFNAHFSVVDASVFSELPNQVFMGEVSLDTVPSQNSLYGALSNGYLSDDLTQLLQLPPIDIAPIQMFRKKTSSKAGNERKVESSEATILPCQSDYGYSDALSDSVPCGGFQPLSWEIKRRCGGLVLNPLKEKPFITEAGPQVFDLLHKLQISCQLQLEILQLEKSNVPRVADDSRRQIYRISLPDLMKDISNLLVGVSSKVFILDEVCDSFSIKKGLFISGLSCQSLNGVCSSLISAGTFYYRLSRLSAQQMAGLSINAFLASIRAYLVSYTSTVLQKKNGFRSPLHISLAMKKHFQQISFLAQICDCDQRFKPDYSLQKFPFGIFLISHLYKMVEIFTSSHMYLLLLNILHQTCQPYLRFLHDWAFNGHCFDPFEEFIIDVDPSKLEAKDRTYWTDGFTLRRDTQGKCLFMDDMTEQVYQAGKSLNLLRIISPDHPILIASTYSPKIDICLSMEDFNQTKSNCDTYIIRAKELLKRSLYSRRMMLADEEQKRVDLIKRAQANQAQRLAEIYKRIHQMKLKDDEKKKKYYTELKENLEEEVLRKKKLAEEEKRNDAEIVAKLASRDQLLTESDAKLQQQAKEELIEYYRLLSETAALRERRALWRIRRHQLSSARQLWFERNESALSEGLRSLRLGADNLVETRSKWVKPVHVRLKADDGFYENAAFIRDSEPSIEQSQPSPSGNLSQEQQNFQQGEKSIFVLPTDKPEQEILEKRLLFSDKEDSSSLQSGIGSSADDILHKNNEHMKPEIVGDGDLPRNEGPLEHFVLVDGNFVPGAQFSSRDAPAFSIHLTNIAFASVLESPVTCDESSDPVSGSSTSRSTYQSDALLSAHSDITHDLEAALSKNVHSYNPANYRRTTKAVDGKHVNSTTFDKEFLVKTCIRQVVKTERPSEVPKHKRRNIGAHPSQQSSIDVDTSQSVKYEAIRNEKRKMTATAESDEMDHDEVRLAKFKQINKLGHASQSTIQNIIYYDKFDDNDPSAEISFPPLTVVNIEELEPPTEYDSTPHNFNVLSPQMKYFREEPNPWRQEDVPIYEHTTVPVLIQQSVAAPLSAQTSLVNQALLSYFLVDLDFDKHMEILHSYLLMAKGEFTLAFTQPLFEKIHCKEGTGLMSTYFLTDSLNKALQLVPLRNNQFLQNLSISKSLIPRNIVAYSLQAFSWLTLSYKIEWPMNIVITKQQLEQYESIFTYMISLHHISYLLTDSWHSLKLSTLSLSGRAPAESQQYRQIHLIRHDMQHFIKVIHGYLALQVTQVSWHQFQDELKNSVKTLDDLFESHNKFIHRCLSRCFLTQKVHQIKQVLDGILKSIHKFHAVLNMGHWELNENDELVHTEYHAIVKIYAPFREFTQFLNKVLTKMTEFDKNPHLRELQLMLNFNNFYNKHNPTSSSVFTTF